MLLMNIKFGKNAMPKDILRQVNNIELKKTRMIISSYNSLLIGGKMNIKEISSNWKLSYLRGCYEELLEEASNLKLSNKEFLLI